MTSTPEPDAAQAFDSAPGPVADERLLAAEDLARTALAEITRPDDVGPAAGYTLESEGVVSLRFETRLAGYPGWFWTVSLARVEDAEPTVLEVELLPGDGALLAPDWVPWAVRLAEYQAAQSAAAEAEADDEESGVDDEDDLEDDDDLDDGLDEDDELDADGSSILHAGDVDGVDIDELDPDDADDEDADGDDDDADADDEDAEDLREY